MTGKPVLASESVPGLYKIERKEGSRTVSTFYVRPMVRGARVWRKLKAITFNAAVTEANKKLTEHERFLAGEVKRSPFAESDSSFASVAQLYLDAGCPATRIEAHRSPKFIEAERGRIEWLCKFFGSYELEDIRLPVLRDHAKWRRAQVTKTYRGEQSVGARAIELEWVTLSNVISYAVYHGLTDFNHIRQQRPVLRVDEPRGSTALRIRHSREVAPPDGDAVHAVARELFLDPRSQSSGWCWLFACLTGLRLSELLALRLDARPPMHSNGVGEPGYTDDRFLHVRRGKRSKLHKVLLYPELQELIHAHFRWHQSAFPSNPFYFPGEIEGQPIDTTTPGHAVGKVCVRLKLPYFTMHGARSFFATVLRSHGLGEAQIAARIGDSTVELIQEAYASIPGNWEGGAKLSFLPSSGLPAWASFPGLDVPTATPVCVAPARS